MTANDAFGYELPTGADREFLLTFEVTDDRLSTVEQAAHDLHRAGSSWRLEPEPGTHPLLLPVRATYTPPARAGIASEVNGDLRNLVNYLHSLGEPITPLFDPLVTPAPGSKGHFPVSSPGHQLAALTRGDADRVPVAVPAGNPPPRRPRGQGRRPVVALLDTKVEPHEWLGGADPAVEGDAFWIDASALGWDPGPRLRPAATGRELGRYEGHGTFCAGLLRQVGPDARVLAVHVIGDDGPAYGDHVLNALGWLETLDGSASLDRGDVVCLPASFRPELPRDARYLELLGTVLTRLAARGIRVVAAAGNEGSPDPVYPAAFATSTGIPEDVRLVSVGAYNTDGRTPAYFSNHGSWVTRWEVGTSVVSTFPRVNRAAAPELVADPGPGDPAGFPRRTTADPDDFTGGFSRWSGTSFAAAIHAGKLAQQWADAQLGAAPAAIG